MKLSKKFKREIKEKIKTIFLFIILIFAALAIFKLANIFASSENKIQARSFNNTQNLGNITIAEDGAIVCDSIVQGVRDSNLADGTHVFRVSGMTSDGIIETQDYTVELINYYDDVTYSLAEGESSTTVSLGDSTTEYKMLVVKYHKNLTINSGVTVTATNVENLTYKKGMYLCVMGELKNKGKISMTARGTYNCAGENVYLWKNIDNSFEYVPAVGGAGNVGIAGQWGKPGENGTNRGTGGGGSGGSGGTNPKKGGDGSAGTSYSGGSGGGGAYHCAGTGTYAGGNAGINGGAGGIGSARTNRSANRSYASGGAGNTAGAGAYVSSGNAYGNAGTYAQNGTGGLLTIYADSFYNTGTISSNGSNVAGARYSSTTRYSGGGASGGGSVNLFVRETIAKGTIEANQGTSTLNTSGLTYYTVGGHGGNGSVTYTELYGDLNYEEKTIELNINSSYSIQRNKLTYLDQNGTQTKVLVLGNLLYESFDTSIATVDNNGKIIAKSQGSTKIKITDTINNLSTYIYLDVINNVKVDVQEGKNFSVALKQNGTVWTYGLNTNGELGIGDNENKLEPTQVLGLNKVKQIATGYSHSLALLENGDVYSWGLGLNGQLGNGLEENSNIPIKVDGISNIVKIDSYKNISISLDSNGNVYVWGENYSTLPMKVIFSEKVIDISGNLMLTNTGKVYSIADTSNEIAGLENIAKISCGEAHNLALSTHGMLFVWGKNTYGECGFSEAKEISVQGMVDGIYDISAGNCVSILKTEDKKIFALGNNASGQLGLDTLAKATSLTEIIVDKEIECISAGEGTHSSLICKDGFVLNTGLNTYGELGTGDITNKTTYSQIGKTIITTNFETKYLDINESATITAILENTFNLKIDIIDQNQDNFSITLSDSTNLLLKDKTVTALDYCTVTATVSHITSPVTKNVKIIAAMKVESIVQGFRDMDLPDGEYTVVVNDQAYPVELINYYDDMIYTENTELGDDSTDYKTLVVKYHKDLTVNSDVTLTAKTVENLTYKKGMYLCVLGNLYNNGTITMTARGTYNQEGEDVFLWKNIDDSFEYVSAEGGDGGTGSSNTYGTKGADGIGRATGGGGAGGSLGTNPKRGGHGSAGTSYSGGSGGGGAYHCAATGTYTGGDAGINGGAGGTGSARTNSTYNKTYASGGAGNKAGAGAYITKSGNAYGNAGTYAQNGTGGLLTIYANNLYNEGDISSNGSNVIGTKYSSTTRYAGGGASGGGSINIFANFVNIKGNIEALGGKSTVTRAGMKYYGPGSAGGAGTVTINELGSILNYNKKKIELNIEESHIIDTSKITYTKLNKIQTEDLIVGTLVYESLDSNIAEVDSTGKITGKAIGKTKIKITDIKNGYSTYIIVTVTKQGLITPQLKVGKEFTVALKANGTVWAFGNNTNGELGNNSTISSNEPIEVITENLENLQNIVDIGVGYNSSIALSKSGEVYTWGVYKSLDETGINQSQNRLVATKELGLSNIVKVDCYKNNFYAVDSDGKLYIWGEGYTSPKIIDTLVKVEDISGELILGQDGLVYLMSNPTIPLQYLSNICEISCGENHYLFLDLNGYIYGLQGNTLGQLGNGKYIDAITPTLVKLEEEYLTNVSSISAGNKASLGVTYDGKLYAWGDNTNKKIGITEAKIPYATQITSLQDKKGNELDLKEIEIVEIGENHSTIADKDGFVYTTGLNTYGQLGTGDSVNRTIYTKIGDIKILTMPEKINVPVNVQKDIIVALVNTFNIKRDIPEDCEIEINNTNEKEVIVEKITNVNNSEVTNVQEFIPNYRFTGNKIGRVNLIATSNDGQKKNIWVNIINDENALVPSKVVNGNQFTIALRADGTVWSFGKNTYGQLGLSDTENRNKPEQITIPEKIIDISSGANHTILLGESGKVYTFGLNSNGQLGTGNSTTYRAPVTLGITNIEKVIAKQNTTFAITNEGIVYAWGEGYTKKPSILKITEMVATGEKDEDGNDVLKEDYKNIIDIGRTYYLAEDGIVRTIKDNSEILLSLNEYDPSEKPVIEDEQIVQISEGIDHVLLLGKSGRVYSYGKNVYGQLGDGTTVARENEITTVVRVDAGKILENIVEISAGDKYAIARSQDGKVYTFGINGEKQLGFDNELEEGGIQESGYAILKEDIFNVERVTAGYVHTAVYKEDGNVYTWGDGIDGELGNAKNSNYYEPQIVGKNIIETNVSEILLEKEETFDIDGWINYFNLFTEKQSTILYEILDGNLGIIDSNSGEIMTIGVGRTTVIVREEDTNNIAVIPIRILEKGTRPENMDILVEPQVVTSGNHTIMLKTNGTVWCYGMGLNGELGNGKKQISDIPVQSIFPTGTIITKIAAGENHCIALDSNGNVWTWGNNNYYQLGNSTIADTAIPTKVSGLSRIKDIEAGIYNSFAIGEVGEVYSFGLNANGEGGIGSYTNKITVSKAKFVTDAIDIKAGKNHTIILKSNGEVFVTGSNLYGELGNDNLIRKTNEFTKVENLNNIVAISSGDSNNTVIALDGSIYSWGANIYKELGITNSTVVKTPRKVNNLKDIRYIDGGKGYNLAINSNNEIYVNGLNTSGELGNNTKNNISNYTNITTIDDVIHMSAGNGYSMMLKSDGTVWACGDYTHGDEEIKSKTKSIIPIQVGNDETGFSQTQITVHVDGTKEILKECSYEFNLIHLEDNFTENLSYESLNSEIATVDNAGIITGIRVGTTRVNAISKLDGKIYSILVNVVKEEKQISPKADVGSDFAAVLRADGNLWTFGYNADGRLGLGHNLTKDIPNKTNIIATYEDIKSGKDFILALRADGTVWSVGNNKNGQLGNGTTSSINKLSQIQGLEDIVKIAAGEDFGIAIDSYGIIYGWGNNSNGQLGKTSENDIINKPIQIQISSQRIIDISAGKNQSVFVTAKGTVSGYGNILNGNLSGINNAIKTQVTKDSIVILTEKSEVYEYKNGNLVQIILPSKVIDISGKNGTIMYQTVDEKTYVTGENIYGELGTGDTDEKTMPVLVNAHGENTYTLAAGYNNTYIIDNIGNVYAAGNNEYGSIGNGTRENEQEHILVGDRIFQVEPKADTMYVGDEEEFVVTGEPFNVFGNKTISSDEYQWSTDSTIITLIPGKITADAEGTAHITITDKITGESTEITRVIVNPESDRIAKIDVNEVVATLDPTSTENDIKYNVQVITNEEKGKLNITTNNLTDRISIDGGITWSYNGTLNQEIELIQKITQIPIIVGVQNNAGEYPVELNYTLTVEKITDDIGIKKITVTSMDEQGVETPIIATPVSLNRYEVAVKEWTNVSLVDVLANSEYSSISIDGLDYTIKQQTKNVVIGNDLTKEVKISVKTEAGNEVEYTLVIYKENSLMNLISLTVNDKQAIKVSEGIYGVTVSKDTQIANIIGTVENNLAKLSVANNDYTIKTNKKELNLESDTTVVPVKVKYEENIKEYTLYIYREQENDITPKLDMLMVNGSIIEAEKDGLTYIAYLPSAEQTAIIRAIAKGLETKVKIADYDEEIGDSQGQVSIINNTNTYDVILTDNTGKSMKYSVIIRKAEVDASLDRIYVSKGDTEIEANIQSDGSYMVKVPNTFEDVDVTAIAGYPKAMVQIGNTGNYIQQQDTSNIELYNDETIVNIKVQSEDGTNEVEYILKIVKYSNNANLEKVYVDGEEAVLAEDGNYHYILNDAKTNVLVNAITNAVSPTNAWVKIENANYSLYTITKQVDIVAKETVVPIKVKAEDGTVKDYKLIIEGLPDDTNIDTVIVNGKKATYIDGKNRYEIRSEDTEFNIEVTLSDLLASMILGSNPKAIGKDMITVNKTGSETIVKVIVTSQNELETQEYTIAILEKSNNTNIDTIKVNGIIVNPDLAGNYKATIKNAETNIEVEAIAEDSYSIVSINGVTDNSYISIVNENVIDGKTIYTYIIKIVAEDGSIKEYNVEVEQLEANTNIIDVLVGKDDTSLVSAILREDGNYYYKIERVNNGVVKINLESTKSIVKINGEVGTVANVALVDEINTIPIQVIAEDGTTKDINLIIEKFSNDTSIKTISGNGVLDYDIDTDVITVNVDEDLTTVDLTIELTNPLSKLKLETDTDYETNKITRTIDLADYAINGDITFNLNVQAEDGTIKDYQIIVYKKADVSLKSVVVNNNNVVYDEENRRYFEIVSNGNKPVIVITPNNSLQTVQLLDENENVLATATGTLTTTQVLSTTNLTTKFAIKVISHNGEDLGSELYDLVIRQKSTETGILYVKVDSLGTLLSSDKLTYSSTVAGKDKYPVEIKLKDENATVRIEDLDDNILINNQKGVLNGELAIADGELKDYTLVVISENGETKEYTLKIERVSSSSELAEITVTDYDTDGTTIITKQVVNYDENTKIYKILVNKNLTKSDVSITAKSSYTTITVDSATTAKGWVSVSKTLNGLGITEIKIDLVAADGSKDTKYLHIIQLSDEIGIASLQVDGIDILPNDSGDYEATVSNVNDLSQIQVTLLDSLSKVSINGNPEELLTSTVDVSKGNNRVLKVPIKVISESGIEYTYTLTLNIISHDTSVKSVKVDNIESTVEEGKYIAYIDRNAVQANVDIISGESYSTVSHTMEDGSEVSNIENLSFILDTPDLTKEIYETTFKVIAEDKTEQEYTIKCIRKSDDNTIAGVYVNDIGLIENLGNPNYADGTYYVAVTETTAKVKVETNNTLAEIKFNNKTGIKQLEQIITLSKTNKITEIPIVITSQQGTTYETVLYIEKLSDNNNLTSVEVNYKDAEKTDMANNFISYIYDTVTDANVKIIAENSNAKIIRTTENGDIYLDANGLSYQGTEVLEMDVPTPNQTNTIYFKIVAESGKESNVYTLNIEKMSTDTTLKEVYVDGVLIQPNEEGKYFANVLDTATNSVVKAVTNYEFAHVRIMLGDEKLCTSEQKITIASGKQTVVPITVRSQSGITEVKYLYINKISTSVLLDSVTLNDKEPFSYNENIHTYRFLIDTDETEFELFVLAENDYCILEYEGIEYAASLKTIVNVPLEAQGRKLKVKAKSEAGFEQIYTIEIARKSDNIDLEYLKVNDVQRYPDVDGGDTYTVIIPKLATTTSIEVKTTHSYSSIRIGDNIVVTGNDKGVLDCSDLTENRIVVPVVVTATDGITVRTYNVVLLRGSNDTQIDLKVNESIITQDDQGNYEVKLPDNIDSIKICGTTITPGILGNYAKIDINATGVYETPTKEIVLTKDAIEGKETLKIPIQVIAEDGTIRENVLTIKLLKATYISGKILTNNVAGLYNSNITIYKTSDSREIGDLVNPREEIVNIQTKPDGSFKALIYFTDPLSINDENANGIADELEETYDLVVTKPGYLTYTVTGIGIKEFNETVLEDYNLIAGDVIKTGEIEIDDLVAINDRYGISIENQEGEIDENAIYDLNEDGIIDEKDRGILQANYGKKAEKVEWINPDVEVEEGTENDVEPELDVQSEMDLESGYEAEPVNEIMAMSLQSTESAQTVESTIENFILPMSCEYTITSEYGMRIHPVTGEEKMHTGIDISGVHHTEIYSVADGEVTFAGVQEGFGNCIEIKHIVNGETIYSFYAHLSRIDVEIGQTVTQGQVIGLEGGDPSIDPNPGSSTGHHLHFELRTASGYGNDTDPNNYIKF